MILLLAAAGLGTAAGQTWDASSFPIHVPRLEKPPRIDGDLSEWKYLAFTDGVWDILRVRQSPWYDPSINRLTVHSDQDRATPPEDDLQARYYMAWDDRYLYLGAEVKDNANDVTDLRHEPKRWYFKDAICWFIEAPHVAIPKSLPWAIMRFASSPMSASRLMGPGGGMAFRARITSKSPCRKRLWTMPCA